MLTPFFDRKTAETAEHCNEIIRRTIRKFQPHTAWKIIKLELVKLD